MSTATCGRKGRKLTKDQRAELHEQRRAAVIALRDRLGQWQEDTDPALVALIIARFSAYSPRNAQLIAMQCPEATEVHGFREWLELGRCVRKGEHGIQILAPAGTYRDGESGLETVKPDEAEQAGADGEKLHQFFRLAYVFDRSQTGELDQSAADEGKAS